MNSSGNPARFQPREPSAPSAASTAILKGTELRIAMGIDGTDERLRRQLVAFVGLPVPRAPPSPQTY